MGNHFDFAIVANSILCREAEVVLLRFEITPSYQATKRLQKTTFLKLIIIEDIDLRTYPKENIEWNRSGNDQATSRCFVATPMVVLACGVKFCYFPDEVKSKTIP